MHRFLHNVFLPESFFTGSARARRRSLLMYLLFLVGACSLPFYVIPHPDYNHAANLIGTVGYWALLLALWRGTPFTWVIHAMLLWSVAYVTYLAAMTGGINSPVMVWMTVTALPCVLLLERKQAVFWVALVSLVHVGLWYISHSGVIDSNVNMTQDVIAWAMANKVCVLALLMYVVFVSERMQQSQTLDMDESNAELERTQLALMRAQTHKDEFIASVGHELRTPMNAILGLNGALRAELAANPDDVAVVDHIRHATQQLLRVVNDILDFSQLQAGRLNLREDEFALADVLTQVLAAHEQAAQAKNIALTLEATALQNQWVKGDRQRLTQVLHNLLNNAIKFTAQGSVVLRVSEVTDGMLFEVQDTGIGIAPEKQAHIFQGFEQADVHTHRLYGGTGLGLAICERLVRLQQGTIGVRSTPGQGACFWFLLPWHGMAAEVAQAVTDMARALPHQPLRVLLVDDNAVNLLVARMMLKKSLPKAEVVEADSGPAALALLREQTFDVVLMDMLMPDMSGLDATRILRQDFPAPACQLPVLALTASVNPADHEQCMAAGMNDVLPKPLDAIQIVAKIAKVLAASKVGA